MARRGQMKDTAWRKDGWRQVLVPLPLRKRINDIAQAHDVAAWRVIEAAMNGAPLSSEAVRE